MNAHGNSLKGMAGRLIRCGVLFGGMLLLSAPGALFAVSDLPPDKPAQQPAAAERDQSPRRMPPQAARDVCAGKSEGDPCTFTTEQGRMDGECLSGNENIFACRPHREASAPAGDTLRPPRQPDAAGQKPLPVRQAGPLSESGTASKALPGSLDQNQSGQPTTAVLPPVPAKPQRTTATDLQGELAWVLGFGLAAALLAAGITWFGFFRAVTIPLRRLRTVTQQLAGGNLSARVGEGLVHRKDEVADLGRDVDRMAERIESLVGAHQRLIRDVSHELRSPLARLNVALELARQSAGPTLSAPFDRIERESDRLNELIGQLLMLTKLESDSGVTQRSDLDIASLIAEVVQDVDFEARSADRRVVMTPGAPLVLMGNRELLRQALENLIRNAARYTAEGSAVEISLSRKETGGRGRAHIEVRDHGPGVPESELADIFRPFYRVNDARERQSGGAGVGLAISDRAVRLHGGSLKACNAQGEGLIMEMELPLA